MKLRTTLLLAALVLAFSACKKNEPAPVAGDASPVTEEALPPGQPMTPPVEPPADAVLPVTVSANAFAVGSALTGDGAATSPKASYALGDTVYASIPGGKYPNGAIARVYWTYAADGTSHKEEEKTVGSGATNFEFGQADGMKAGEYNVEIHVNDKPVGIVDVVVK